MDIEKASLQMTNALKGFHGRFKIMYGQAALRLDGNSYLATGSNSQLSAINEDNFVVCDINTGDLGEIFRNCPEVNAILFGCSQDTVTVSQRDTNLPVTLEDLAHLTGPFLKVIPDSSPANIISAIKNSDLVLIKGLGVLAACSNMRRAVAGVQIAQKACEAEIHGKMLGGTVPIPDDIAEQLQKEFMSEYVNRNESEEVAYMRFEETEFSLRSQLIDYGKELVKRDLAYGSWGNLSVRLNENEMLITPSSMDYFEIKPEDIVRVNIYTLDHGDQRVPSSTVSVHASLYRALPDCNAIIHSHSNALSVFAACKAGFAITEPDLHQLIGDILITEPAYTGSEKMIKCVTETMRHTHAAIIPQHGGIFTGPSLDIVLAIAEAVELRARNLLNYDVRPAH